ncbi:MAG: hypothetical protein HY260_15635 [Chloroflexi bacterium]|nr:hypothetical protein [Chloroflexota bacterium]
MPVQIPETLRRVLGGEAVADFVPLVQQIVAEMAVPRDEYRQVLSRLDILEHDMADVKASLRALNERFDQMYQHFETMFDRQNRHIETRFDVMNQRFDARFDAVNERLDRMSERMLVQTRWMVGTIALFGTLITLLLAVSRFAP